MSKEGGEMDKVFDRRTLLRYGAAGVGATAFGGLFAACGSGSSASEEADAAAGTTAPATTSAGAGDGGFKVALSNAYIGNEWRVQMGEAYDRAAEEMKQHGIFSSYSSVHGSDNAVDAQIAAVNDMILEKNDAILMVCSSGSQVNGVIEDATDAGIRVVSFDAYATSDKSWNIGFDFGSWGRNNADFVENYLGGQGKAEGNVLVVLLSLGAVAGQLIREEYQKMFDRNPGINVVGEVEGQATRSVAQKNVSQILPSLPKIDAVLGAGGNDSFGIVEGFLAAGYKDEDVPPICTGADGDYIQWWIEQRDKRGYEATGLNAQPEIAAWAVYYTAQILQAGETQPKDFFAPSVLVDNQTIDQYKDVTGQRIPVQTFTYDEIPGAFTPTDKLPG